VPSRNTITNKKQRKRRKFIQKRTPSPEELTPPISFHIQKWFSHLRKKTQKTQSKGKYLKIREKDTRRFLQFQQKITVLTTQTSPISKSKSDYNYIEPCLPS
jgi:hypothetical protein